MSKRPSRTSGSSCSVSWEYFGRNSRSEVQRTSTFGSAGGGAMKHTANSRNRSNLGTFFIIWFGQVASTLGTWLTRFALGVWVYQETGSVTQFALITFVTSLPAVLCAPVAGVLVDRWNRRTAMIVADGAAAVCTLALAILFGTGRIEIWHIYVALALSNGFSSLQWPAYSAAVGALVPKEHYGRASGFVQIGEALAQIVAPAAGAGLLVSLGIFAVMLTDLATALIAVGTLIVARIPGPAPDRESGGEKRSFREDAVYGWKFIRERGGLLGLLGIVSTLNFAFVMVQILIIPYVLTFADAAALGAVTSFAFAGAMVGTLAMSAWGGPKRKLDGIIAGLLVLGAAVVVAAVRPSLILVAVCGFLAFSFQQIINGCSQAVWLAKTPQAVQGRVFAIRRMIAWATLPLTSLLAGPLSDRVFEPLLAPGGALSSSVGLLIGVGPGRGTALLIMVLGIVSAGCGVAALMIPAIRRVEERLPDADAARAGEPAA